MPSKVEVRHRLSLSLCARTMILVCTSVWWASVYTRAQEATSTALRMTTDSNSWSLERPESNQAPYLVISMARLSDIPPYGSLRIAGDRATNPTAGNTKTRQLGTAASADRTKGVESGPLALSSLPDPASRIRDPRNFRAELPSPRQTIQRSPGQADAKAYSLLDPRSAPGSFLYGYQADYLPSKQWLADNEDFTRDPGQAPRPLLQLEFGVWRLPVVLMALSGAAVSR
jgi:hypothetical protein